MPTRANVTLTSELEEQIEAAYSSRFWLEMSMAKKVILLVQEGLKLAAHAEVLAALLEECDRSSDKSLKSLAAELKILVESD